MRSVLNANLAVEQTGECSRIKRVFLLLDALVKRRGGVIREHGYHALCQNGAGVDAVIHHVNGATGGLHPVIVRLLPGLQPRKCGQQRGVNINDIFLECTQKITLQNAHETGQSHPLGPGFTERGDVGRLGGFVQFGAEFTGSINRAGRPDPAARSRIPASATSLATSTMSAGSAPVAQALANETRFDPLPEPSTASLVLSLMRFVPSGRAAG